jgi:hypothetical protein
MGELGGSIPLLAVDFLVIKSWYSPLTALLLSPLNDLILQPVFIKIHFLAPNMATLLFKPLHSNLIVRKSVI